MLGGSLTQRAVRSCGQCGEMPLKIMLNVRDTQTHSSRRLVPLSTAKPIYCNTRVRSIKVHTHTHTLPHIQHAGRKTKKAGAPLPFLFTPPPKQRSGPHRRVEQLLGQKHKQTASQDKLSVRSVTGLKGRDTQVSLATPTEEPERGKRWPSMQSECEKRKI